MLPATERGLYMKKIALIMVISILLTFMLGIFAQADSCSNWNLVYAESFCSSDICSIFYPNQRKYKHAKYYERLCVSETGIYYFDYKTEYENDGCCWPD
jgi:predicted permease